MPQKGTTTTPAAVVLNFSNLKGATGYTPNAIIGATSTPVIKLVICSVRKASWRSLAFAVDCFHNLVLKHPRFK